jgi:hypothetical protein
MTISFLKLWENMKQKDAEDTKAMQAIRMGNNISENFWEDFIRVCNNAEGLADLLDVRSDQVSGWSSKIKHNLEKIEKSDKFEKNDEKPKTSIIDTGDLTNIGGISTGDL